MKPVPNLSAATARELHSMKQTYEAYNKGPKYPNIEARLHCLREAWNDLREMLPPEILENAQATIATQADQIEEMPSGAEFTVMACGIYKSYLADFFDANDVLDLTRLFRGKSMNTPMVYKCIRQLWRRGLLFDCGEQLDEFTERPSQTYAVTALGRDIFSIWVVMADQLRMCRLAHVA